MRKLFFFLLVTIVAQQLFSQERSERFRMLLHDDCRMKSSLTDKATGAQVSQSDFSAQNWYKITMPSTIIARLLENNKYHFYPFYAKTLVKLADNRLDHTLWFRK